MARPAPPGTTSLRSVFFVSVIHLSLKCCMMSVCVYVIPSVNNSKEMLVTKCDRQDRRDTQKIASKLSHWSEGSHMS